MAKKHWQDKSWTEAEKWEKLNTIPRFWANLPKMAYAKFFWNQISQYDPYILTACPPEMPQGVEEKEDWCEEQLGINRDRVIVVMSRHDKKNYAVVPGTRLPNILIDDYNPNVRDWQQAGGVGIQHLGVLETLDEVREVI